MATTVSDGTTTITPALVLGYEAAKAVRNIPHELLDGGLDVSLLPAGMREGTLSLLFETEQQAADCETMHTAPARFTLASDELTTIAMQYVLAPDTQITRRLDPDTRQLWIVDIEYQEVS